MQHGRQVSLAFLYFCASCSGPARTTASGDASIELPVAAAFAQIQAATADLAAHAEEMEATSVSSVLKTALGPASDLNFKVAGLDFRRFAKLAKETPNYGESLKGYASLGQVFAKAELNLQVFNSMTLPEYESYLKDLAAELDAIEQGRSARRGAALLDLSKNGEWNCEPARQGANLGWSIFQNSWFVPIPGARLVGALGGAAPWAASRGLLFLERCPVEAPDVPAHGSIIAHVPLPIQTPSSDPRVTFVLPVGRGHRASAPAGNPRPSNIQPLSGPQPATPPPAIQAGSASS